jgi:hypothetical protein
MFVVIMYAQNKLPKKVMLEFVYPDLISASLMMLPAFVD